MAEGTPKPAPKEAVTGIHNNPLVSTEPGYLGAREVLRTAMTTVDGTRARLVAEGRPTSEARTAIEPLVSFEMGALEQVEGYHRAFNGELPETVTLDGLHGLVRDARLASGKTQAELGAELGVPEAEIARAEQSYDPVTPMEEVGRRLVSLGIHTVTTVAPKESIPTIPRNRNLRFPY